MDVSQKLTAICVVNGTGRRLWRGQCATDPERLERTVKGHAGEDARIGIETGPMTPWLVHEQRARGLSDATVGLYYARERLSESAQLLINFVIHRLDATHASIRPAPG